MLLNETSRCLRCEQERHQRQQPESDKQKELSYCKLVTTRKCIQQIVGFLYQILCLECDIRHIGDVITKNMTKMTNSGTKGESLTKKHDIRRTAGERRGTEAYEFSFGSIKEETVRLSKPNASIKHHSECIRERSQKSNIISVTNCTNKVMRPMTVNS